jgi:phage terminase large subunit-like protein
MPFQKRFILEIYDNPVGTRRAYLSVGRKNGKTALIACILLAHLVGPEAKLNAQIISGAMSREQAAIVYDLASKMVALSPRLRELVREVPSSKKLIGIKWNTEFRAISAEGKTAHGLSPMLAILDELGQVRGPQSDFVDAITTSQGAHVAPLLMVISTQAPNDNDLLSIWLDDAKTSNDKRIVSHVYEAAKDCELMDRTGWKDANPAIGKFRSLADVKEQAERAGRMPSSEPTFRNLVLNQRIEMMAPFISRGVWVLNSAEPDDQIFYEEPVYCGLDLSAKTDLTSMVMIAYREKWHVKAYFWTPAKGLRDRSKRDRAPYDVWEGQGFIRAIPGAAVDYEAVAKDMADILQDCDVRALMSWCA